MPAALVAQRGDAFGRAMVSALENTGCCRFVRTGIGPQEAERLMENGDVAFIVTIPSDFSDGCCAGTSRNC